MEKQAYGINPTLQAHLENYTTLWVKFATPQRVNFVGCDVLCLTNGCQIILHNLITRTEQVINANGEQYGEGVTCIGGHKTHPLLAYAEKREPPRVFVVRTTDLKYAPGLKCNFSELSALSFSDSELLFGLSGYPECSLVVWKWRTAEIMKEIDTGMFFNKNVILKNGFSTQPIYVAQVIMYTSEMKMWEAAVCGKKCILKEEIVTFDAEDPRLKISQVVWSNDGSCFAMDTNGNVFKYDFETSIMRTIVKSFSGSGPASFCWWGGGLLVQGSDSTLRHYKDSNYTLQWASPKAKPFVNMYATPSRDHLLVQTEDGDLLLYEANTHSYPYLRSDEASITHFGLVPPQNDLIVTLNKHTTLAIWDTATGVFVHSLTLDTPATHLASNHTYPYVALTFSNGTLKLYSILKREIQPLCLFNLTKSHLQETKFFEQNRLIVTACKDEGQVFVIEGVPGGKFKVLAGIVHNAQIADYIVLGSKTCLKIFLIPVTSSKFLAGNKIVRYCVLRHQEPTTKIYELENPEKLYMSLYVGKNQPTRDRVFYAQPFDNKNLHELEIKRGEFVAKITNRFISNHMLRHIHYVFDSNYVISYGFDGIAVVRNLNFDIKHVLVPHHRRDGGVLSAAYDNNNHRLITLGRDGLLMCCEHPGNPISSRNQAQLFAKNQELEEMFKTPSVGFNPRGIYEGVCWLEYKRLVKIDQERLQFDVQRKKIVASFNSIQSRAVILLSHNIEGPKNERLELQDFNLNLQRKEDLTRASTYQCEKLKLYLEKYIVDQDRISSVIKETFWNPIDQPTKNLWAIFGNFDVQSYAVLPPDMTEAEKLQRIEGYKEIEEICARDDSFKPWTYLTNDQKENLPNAAPTISADKPEIGVNLSIDEEDDDSTKQTRESEYETFVSYFGSPVPLYINLADSQYEQAEIQSFLQQEWSYSVSTDQQHQLRNHFNKKFEECVQLKIKEMGNIIERNARLRYIISEMNYFTKEDYDFDPIDPEWRQDEHPELITKVENNEVGILPYISPSEQAILDAKAAEEERYRLMMLGDDFKDRALMKMMNGVLEIRWEDELRREVPKPKCMFDRNPENYTEEDLKVVKEYEEQVAFLNSERKRYQTILTAEYIKVGNQLRDGVKRFNDKLKELLVKKIQIDAALTNELLRMHRLRVRGLKRVNANIEENNVEQEIIENEATTEEMANLIGTLNSDDSELKTTLEQLLLKERFVEKQFRREFQDYSPAQFEILTKLYKKRPRLNFKLITSASGVQEMAKVVATNCQPMLIFGEALEFIKLLDALDKYVGIPPIVDEQLYYSMVRIRRLKIEAELKIRACQMEIAEAEATQQMYQMHHAKRKDHGTQLQFKLETIRTEKIKNMLNNELQLVMKQAFVELPRTGCPTDFIDAILINRQDVEDINNIIQKTGAKKIKAMRNAMQFRKEIMYKEWLHKKKKMEIADLEHELLDIQSIKLTKEIQQFLKVRSRGEQEKTVSFEHELFLLKERYQKQISNRRMEVNDLGRQVKEQESERDRLNKEIQRVNIDVCEANVHVDEHLGDKEKKFIDMRIQANLKRSRMVNQIQVNHNQILVLQAELELCRLKTVPILDYKIEDA